MDINLGVKSCFSTVVKVVWLGEDKFFTKVIYRIWCNINAVAKYFSNNQKIIDNHFEYM